MSVRRHTTKQDHEPDHEPEHGGRRNSRGSGSDVEQEVESAPWLPRMPHGKPCWTKTLSWFSATLGPHFPTPGRVRVWADVNPTEVAVFRDQGAWTHHIPLETHSCSDGRIKALRQVESEPGGRSLRGHQPIKSGGAPHCMFKVVSSVPRLSTVTLWAAYMGL